MTLTKETWRQRWLGSINELTSLELQQNSWLDRHNKNPHWSFVEFMCSYFDDLLCDFPYYHYVDIGWVSSEEYQLIKPWHEELAKYQSPGNRDYDNKAILVDEKWLDIVKAGATAKDKLANILSDEEKQALTEKIDHLQYQ